MGQVSFNWHGSRVLDAVAGATPAGLAAGGELMVQRLKEAVSIIGPPPSAPGEAPHVESGNFQDSMTYEVSPDGTLIFGSTSPYAGHLELGTMNMAARPFLSTTVDQNREEFAHVIADTMKSTIQGGGAGVPGKSLTVSGTSGARLVASLKGRASSAFWAVAGLVGWSRSKR